MGKFEYSPGLPGYGTRGIDGSTGLTGLATYFSSYSGNTDSITIKSKIVANKMLFPTDEYLPGYPNRIYQNGDVFIDKNGSVFQIDLNNVNLYVATSQQLNTSGFFESGPITSSTPIYSRYSNAYVSSKILVDTVYTASNVGNYAASPTSIYGIPAYNYGYVNYTDNTINSYEPIAVYTSTTDITKPEKSIALVKEHNNNTWRLGNKDNTGSLRDVSLYLDFKDIYTEGTLHGSFIGSVTADSLYLPQWLRVDGDASFNNINADIITANNDVYVNDGVRTTFMSTSTTYGGAYGTTTNHGLAFYTVGQPRMIMDVDGNVGIKTSANASYALNIGGYALVNSRTLITDNQICRVDSTSDFYVQNYSAANGNVHLGKTESGTITVENNLGVLKLSSFYSESDLTGSVPNDSLAHIFSLGVNGISGKSYAGKFKYFTTSYNGGSYTKDGFNLILRSYDNFTHADSGDLFIFSGDGNFTCSNNIIASNNINADIITANNDVYVNDGVRTTFMSTSTTYGGAYGTTTNHGLAFYTVGQPRMIMDVDGNVGIKTSANASYALNIGGYALVNSRTLITDNQICRVDSTSDFYVQNYSAANGNVHLGRPSTGTVTVENELTVNGRANMNNDFYSYNQYLKGYLYFSQGYSGAVGCLPSSTTEGKTLNVYAGTTTLNGNAGGDLRLTAGNAGDAYSGIDGGTGGGTRIYGGNGGNSIPGRSGGDGGLLLLRGGDGGTNYSGVIGGDGGEISLIGGDGGTAIGNNYGGNGGNIIIKGGNTNNISSYTSGGNVYIYPGRSSDFIYSNVYIAYDGGDKGVALFASGSASRPGIAFAAQTGLGFFRGAASRIGVSNGASEKFRFDNTTFLCAGDIIAYSTALSDIRLKTNINILDDCLSKVLQLNAVSYDKIDTGEHHIGYIAQDVEKIIPEVVVENSIIGEPDDVKFKGIRYQEIIPYLSEAIKEQQKIINKQQKDIEMLINELKEIKNKI